MKIEKMSLDGKKIPLEINDKIFAKKVNKKLISEILYKNIANYKGRKAAAAQEMMISATEEQLAVTNGAGGHGRWGHDFKLLEDPFGRDTRFNKELDRFTPEQKKSMA